MSLIKSPLLPLAVATAVLALATSAVLDPHHFSKVNSVHDDLPQQKLPPSFNNNNHNLLTSDPVHLSDDDDGDADDDADDDYYMYYHGAEEFIDPSTKLDDDDADDDADDYDDSMYYNYHGAEDSIDPSTKLDGITLKDLTPEELYLLLDDEDDMVVSELDIIVLRRKVLGRTNGQRSQAEAETRAEDNNDDDYDNSDDHDDIIIVNNNNNNNSNNNNKEGEVEKKRMGDDGVVRRTRMEEKGKKQEMVRRKNLGEEGEKGKEVGMVRFRRKKRWGLVARAAARALFSGASRGRLTTSGSRLTRQYNRRGSFGDAVRDFNRFNPTRQSSFNGRISGRSGQVGNHRITVRDGSSGGRPTLEIRSPRPDGSTYVRKFRYQQ